MVSGRTWENGIELCYGSLLQSLGQTYSTFLSESFVCGIRMQGLLNITRARAAPDVTIGLPAYNDPVHIVSALDSLLGQSFGDFELLISDNASTDETAEICRNYAARDPRIRYVRQAQNLGATANWNFVARHCRTPFFKWAASNDLCPPRMLEKCVAVLRAAPDVALCYGNTMLIDDKGASLGEHTSDPEILDRSPSVRFIRVINELVWNNAQSGLIRTSSLLKTRLDRDYIDGDMVLMAEIALDGGFRKLEDICLYRRMDRGSATRFLTDAERQNFLVPNSAGRSAPVVKRHIDRLYSILRSGIPLSEKRRALGYTLRVAYWDRDKIARNVRDYIKPGTDSA